MCVPRGQYGRGWLSDSPPRVQGTRTHLYRLYTRVHAGGVRAWRVRVERCRVLLHARAPRAALRRAAIGLDVGEGAVVHIFIQTLPAHLPVVARQLLPSLSSRGSTLGRGCAGGAAGAGGEVSAVAGCLTGFFLPSFFCSCFFLTRSSRVYSCER